MAAIKVCKAQTKTDKLCFVRNEMCGCRYVTIVLTGYPSVSSNR